MQRLVSQLAAKVRAHMVQPRITAEVRRALDIPQPGFPQEIALPPNFGVGSPERVVEVPLVRWTYRPGARVLDVGHANAMPCHLRMISSLPEPRNLTGIDIVNPTYNVSRYYARSVVGDVVRSGFPDGAFDVIWCISALEHFGMDNAGYGASAERTADLDVLAVREMWRILAPGGVLLITVPYGAPEDHGWLRCYDAQRWGTVLDQVRPAGKVTELYFRHTSGAGWRRVPPEVLRYTGYLDQTNWGAAGLAAAHIQREPAG